MKELTGVALILPLACVLAGASGPDAASPNCERTPTVFQTSVPGGDLKVVLCLDKEDNTIGVSFNEITVSNVMEVGQVVNEAWHWFWAEDLAKKEGYYIVKGTQPDHYVLVKQGAGCGENAKIIINELYLYGTLRSIYQQRIVDSNLDAAKKAVAAQGKIETPKFD